MHLLAPPTPVITAFALDANQQEDVSFQSAQFPAVGTNIATRDVPNAMLPAALLGEVPNDINQGPASVRVPVAFTVTRNVDMYLPRRLNNGRYWHVVESDMDAITDDCVEYTDEPPFTLTVRMFVAQLYW